MKHGKNLLACLLCLAGLLRAATQDAGSGMSLMWATPILEQPTQPAHLRLAVRAAAQRAVDEGAAACLRGWAASGALSVSELNQHLASLALTQWQHFLTSEDSPEVNTNVASKYHNNEAFFRWQQRLNPLALGVLRSTQETESTQGGVASQEGVAAVGVLRELIRQGVQGFLTEAGAAGGHATVAADGSVVNAAGEPFVWMGVLEEAAAHLPHTHSGAVASGTYYAMADHGAGSLVLEDPRGGGRPPFDNRRFVAAQPGKLVVFPGWCLHHVTPTQITDEGLPRISFSFNMPGSWEALADVNVHW